MVVSGYVSIVETRLGKGRDMETCETVAQYNMKHGEKAWGIVGMTWEGKAYCVRASCARNWSTYEHDLTDSPKPIFGTDDYRDMSCDNCNGDMYRDVCSGCGYDNLLSDMVDLTRIGYDPVTVMNCAECTTREG
jgi:hypothetical protein